MADYDKAAYFAWMDELNAEAVRRGCDPAEWPMPEPHSETCYLTDFEEGRTPVEALDASGWHTAEETARRAAIEQRQIADAKRDAEQRLVAIAFQFQELLLDYAHNVQGRKDIATAYTRKRAEAIADETQRLRHHFP